MRHLAAFAKQLTWTDSHLSQFPPSILAMASIAVAIGGMNSEETKTEKTCWRLTEIVTQIHEATHKINEVSLHSQSQILLNKTILKLIKSYNKITDFNL